MLMFSGIGFPTEAATWVPIQGNVRLADGTPICAMVLANGQYMFSCGGDGAYSLNVPLDPQGQVTLFAFADGFAPFRVTAVPAQLPGLVRPWTAAPGSPLIAMTRGMECAANTWVHISGDIESFGGAPLCAMVLANGQHMFSCDASQGIYDLTVPADENGNITVFGFADGFQPYSETFISPDCGSGVPTPVPTVPQHYIGQATVSLVYYDLAGNRVATNTWQRDADVALGPPQSGETNPFSLTINTNPGIGLVLQEGLFNIQSFVRFTMPYPYLTQGTVQFWTLKWNKGTFSGSLARRYSVREIDRASNIVDALSVDLLGQVFHLQRPMLVGAVLSGSADGTSLNLNANGNLLISTVGEQIGDIEFTVSIRNAQIR